MADTPAPQPGTIAYAEWKRRQAQATEKAQPAGETRDQPGEPKLERPDGRTKGRTSVATKKATSQRPTQRTKERLTDRRPYDFFRDQILWLNKTKVEIQEKYGRRVTANAMVQLAVDWLMQDYKRRKERSKLVTKLVSNQPTEERPDGRT
jgi:hypothetical protein